MNEVPGQKGGPLGVVNGTPWSGEPEPAGWLAGALGPVTRTIEDECE